MMLDHYRQTKNLLVNYSPKALGFFQGDRSGTARAAAVETMSEPAPIPRVIVTAMDARVGPR